MAKKIKRKLSQKIDGKASSRVSRLNRARIVAEVEKNSPLKKTKIKVIGIGGGGGNIVSELAQKLKKATFLAANTDLQALRQISQKVECFSFGQSFTHGLGTGMNPELAETAIQNEKERIKKIFQNQDFVIFIACLGGGTGSGAASFFAKICQSLGKLSYGIFTLPFKFEGERKMEIAKRALEILRPKLNTITVLPNERIFQIIDKNTPLKEAFSAINKNLAESLEGLIETIYQPGLINIDFADLKTVLEGQGRVAYLNTFSLPRKEGTVKEAVEKAIISPLYPYGIKGSKGVLFNIVGEKGITLEEVNQISKTISEKANPIAKIIFGISSAGKDQKTIKTTIFATGCAAKIFSGEVLKKPKKKKNKAKKNKAEKNKEEKNKAVPVPQKPVSAPKIKKIKTKKVKIKVSKDIFKNPEIKEESGNSEAEKKILSSSLQEIPPKEKKFPAIQVKTRKSALQIKKDIEEEEKEMIEKEKFWETPTFLRKKISEA